MPALKQKTTALLTLLAILLSACQSAAVAPVSTPTAVVEQATATLAPTATATEAPKPTITPTAVPTLTPTPTPEPGLGGSEVGIIGIFDFKGYSLPTVFPEQLRQYVQPISKETWKTRLSELQQYNPDITWKSRIQFAEPELGVPMFVERVVSAAEFGGSKDDFLVLVSQPTENGTNFLFLKFKAIDLSRKALNVWPLQKPLPNTWFSTPVTSEMINEPGVIDLPQAGIKSDKVALEFYRANIGKAFIFITEQEFTLPKFKTMYQAIKDGTTNSTSAVYPPARAIFLKNP